MKKSLLNRFYCNEDPDGELLPFEETLNFLNPSNGIVVLDKAIDDEFATKFIDDLYRAAFSTEGPITIIINSPGGEVYSSLAIIDAIQSVPNKTIGFVLGRAASAAFYAHQACDYRIMTKNSLLFWHEMIWCLEVSLTTNNETKKLFDDYRKLNNHLISFFRKRGNISNDIWSSVFEGKNDITFTSSEAVKYGLVDKTITKFQEIGKLTDLKITELTQRKLNASK